MLWIKDGVLPVIREIFRVGLALFIMFRRRVFWGRPVSDIIYDYDYRIYYNSYSNRTILTKLI